MSVKVELWKLDFTRKALQPDDDKREFLNHSIVHAPISNVTCRDS